MKFKEYLKKYEDQIDESRYKGSYKGGFATGISLAISHPNVWQAYHEVVDDIDNTNALHNTIKGQKKGLDNIFKRLESFSKQNDLEYTKKEKEIIKSWFDEGLRVIKIREYEKSIESAKSEKELDGIFKKILKEKYAKREISFLKKIFNKKLKEVNNF